MANALRERILVLNQGRIIPAENVRILEPPQESIPALQAPTLTPEEDTAPHETEVILLRDGDRVKTIVIKCNCGQVTSAGLRILMRAPLRCTDPHD